MVAGDFNEVLGETTRGLTRLHSECGLADAVLEKHGDTNFTTYQRGKSVIDYILVDDNVFRCIKLVGYEQFNLHILSDRRGIFMDLSTAQCFGSAITPLLPRAIRDLSTKRSQHIAPYFDVKHKHLLDHH